MRLADRLTNASIKDRFDRISGARIALSTLIWLLLAAIAVGAIVGLDSYLATYVDEHYWSLMYLYEFPYKVTLITAVLLCATGIVVAWAARAREIREIPIVAMLISMQLVSIGAAGLDPIDILTASMTIFIVAYALVNPTNPIKFPLILYFALAIGILDLPYAAIDGPIHFISGLARFAKSAILPLILVFILTSERLVQLFVRALIAVAFVSACIGILQVIVFALSGIPLIIVDDFEQAMKPTPFGMMLRAHGFNPETHTLSQFLLIALPFAIYSVSRSNSTRQTILTGIVAGTIILGVILTWSYGGIISVGVILGLFPLFRWPHRSIHYLLALLMIPVFLYATGLIYDIYNIILAETSLSTGVFQRKWLILITLDEIGRNPWIGRGFETVQLFSGNYMPHTVHNAYLEAWAATGPLGFAVFVAMLLIFTTNTFILGFSGSGEQEHRLRMVTIALISLLILMISEPALFATSTWVLLGFAQALILLYRRQGNNPRSMDSTTERVGSPHRPGRK